jgi:hypothetical protein
MRVSLQHEGDEQDAAVLLVDSLQSIPHSKLE